LLAHDLITINPDEMEAMSKAVKNGRYLFCPTGSHLSMWDAQEEYYPSLIQFIKDVDEGKF
jgi:proline iminopeptidase